MKLKPTRTVQFRRRREGKTDYSRRLKLLLSKKPRLVVRKSLKYIRVQIIEFGKNGDKTIITASSEELRKLGWKFACDNLPAAYLTGFLIGKKSVKKDVKEAVLDTGLYSSSKGSRIYAVVKGAVDAGLNVPCGDVFPSEERIKGMHIAKYKELKSLPEEFERIKQAIK
jgi:large subunit ribosomal protein L18